MNTIIYNINYGILIFFIGSAIIYTLLLIGAIPNILRFFSRRQFTTFRYLLQSEELPPVTIITSFYNEQEIIIENTQSSLRSDYKNLYIVLVNDGSTDDSLNQLIEHFDMVEEPAIYDSKLDTAEIYNLYISRKNPRLIVINKEHSGVGDSLNAGLNFCFTPYFATIDADSIIDKSAISEMMYELLANPNTIGVGGGVNILNACTYKNGEIIEPKIPYRLVPAIQSNEYLRSHLFNRTGWNSFGATMSYSGTASLFNREEVIDAKGYDTKNYAQDTEMVMRLHHNLHQKKKNYQIRFNPSASIWTGVPDTLKSFSRQRDRWQRGVLRSVFAYVSMFFNPKYKIQGMVSYPIYVLLEVVAPVVEFTAYFSVTIAYFMGFLDLTSVILYILLAWGFTSYLTIANMFINLITFNRYKRVNDIIWMFFLAVIEMFGFRQYHTGVKIWGTFHYIINRLRGKAL